MQNPLLESRPSRLWQLIGASGIVYAILYAVGLLVLDNNSPGFDASGSSILAYYAAHHAVGELAIYLVVIASILFAFFLSALHRALSVPGGDSGHLSLVVVIGGAVYLGGLLLGALLMATLIDGHQSSAAESMNLLQQDDFIPIVAGLSIVSLGTGAAGLRGRSLPIWVSVASLVLGVLAVAGPLGEIAFLITPAWTMVIGVVLIVRAHRPTVREPQRDVAMSGRQA